MTTLLKPMAPVKAFFCHLYDEPGVITKVDGVIRFLSDAGALIDFEPEMAPWTTILGEVGLADTQAIMDRLAGGYARRCTSRAQEVA